LSSGLKNIFRDFWNFWNMRRNKTHEAAAKKEISIYINVGIESGKE